MSDPLVTRATLLAKVRDPKDSVAWGQFAEIYRPLIYSYCAKRGLQDADATDVTQDVMQAIAGAIGRFEYDPRRGGFRNWLLTVTRNKLNNYFAHSQRREQGSGRTSVHEMLAEQPDPSSEETQEWDRAYARRLFDWAAQEARSEFKGSTWRAFYMTAVENKPAQEAAAETGLSVGAVYVAKSRVLSRLRQLVAGVSEDESVAGPA